MRRIRGPLLDRIDLRVDLTAVPWQALWERSPGTGSAAVRARVVEARERAAARLGRLNAELRPEEIRALGTPDAAGENLLERAVGRWGLTARGCHRVLRVARTIADLAGADGVAAVHVAEALRYRVEG